MNYKVLIYFICVLVSVFVVSGMNINQLFKKNKLWEERIFVIIISLIMGYLLAEFLITFINQSKIL